MLGRFPFYSQLEEMDCGPTCLRMIAKYYGKTISLDFLRNKSQYGKLGVSLLGLSDAAESIGFKTIGAKLTWEQIIDDAPLPAILHWDQYHFVVITPKSTRQKVVIADPAKGIVTLTKEEFLNHWIATDEDKIGKGTALLLETTPAFKDKIEGAENKSRYRLAWTYFWDLLLNNKGYWVQVLLGIALGSLLQLIFPFLTQSMVDTGIHAHDLSFIQIILLAQSMLLFSQTIIEFIRSRILLHLSTRINVAILSGFWIKLLKLPLHFFDTKHPGDIIQRIADHKRIESFLTGAAINTFFSFFTLIIFSVVLLTYNTSIFFVFLIGSVLYLLWISLFLRLRRKLDYSRFAIASKENNATMQLIYGMNEIKLNTI